jgi:phosphonate transport system ATP-binding protein
MDILADMNERDGITILVSLHQVEYALTYCPRTIALQAGKVVYDGPSDALTPALLGSIYGAESGEFVLPNLNSPNSALPAPRRRYGNDLAPVALRVAPNEASPPTHPAQIGRGSATGDRLTA